MTILENNFNRIGIKDMYFNTRYVSVSTTKRTVGPSVLDFMYTLKIVNFIKRN